MMSHSDKRESRHWWECSSPPAPTPHCSTFVFRNMRMLRTQYGCTIATDSIGSQGSGCKHHGRKDGCTEVWHCSQITANSGAAIHREMYVWCIGVHVNRSCSCTTAAAAAGNVGGSACGRMRYPVINNVDRGSCSAGRCSAGAGAVACI